MENPILSLFNGDTAYISKYKEILSGMNIVDIAQALEKLDKEHAITLYRILPKGVAAEVFAHMDSDRQQNVIEALTDIEVGEIMNMLFVDDAVDFIEEMPANVVKRVLQNVQAEKRSLINQLLQYPEDSAGSIMTTEYVDLPENASVREAFDTIRNTGLNKETIYTCYVISRDRLLLGIVTAKNLMLARPNDLISGMMETKIVYANTTDDQEAVVEQFRKYDLLAIPVVDKEKRLVGIVTVDDAMDVIVEESTEDMEKMSALKPSADPYLKTSVLTLAKNRIGWLLVLMLSATFTAMVIEGFEDALLVVPLLVAFIPMLMDTAGSAGSQSAVLIIRGMALNEIKIENMLAVWWKELRVAALCGIVLMSVNFGRVLIMNQNFEIALTTSLAVCATVIMAKTVGCFLPVGARLIKIDPAVMASPVITTIADVLSLIVYFNLARLIINI
ncbi:MAG: magnesium transporter [Spirochaetes bacterium]|nr:magnesium transporter [Spirochaetota bacterium]